MLVYNRKPSTSPLSTIIYQNFIRFSFQYKIPIFSIGLIVFLFLFFISIPNNYHQVLLSDAKFKRNLDKCQMIDWPLFDQETSPLFKNLSQEKYVCSQPKILIKRINFTGIEIQNPENLNIQCTGTEVKRSKSDRYILGEKFGKLNHSVVDFGFHSKIDAVQIDCYLIKSTEGTTDTLNNVTKKQEKTLIESTVVPLIQVKTNSRNTENMVTSASDKPNVLLFSLDSISWLNFRRHFIRTKRFIESQNFIPMKKFNKVGSNTFPNLMAVLTGDHYWKVWNSTNSNATFDNVPLIWKDFSKQGYLTTLVEDMPVYSLFNYEKPGFKETPTDYYLRPVSIMVDNDLNHSFCYKNQLTLEFYYAWLLDQIEFLSQQRKRYFTLIHMAGFTHDEPLNAGYCDGPVLEFFEKLFSHQFNNNTVIFFYSDHGIRFGSLRMTRSGHFEERTPFYYVYIPEEFYLDSDKARQTLRYNTDRLTTHFDTHATLRHIIDGKSPTDEPYGVSLLTKVSTQRDCSTAGISLDWCTCFSDENLIQSPALINFSADRFSKFVIEHLNEILAKKNFSKKCSELFLLETQQLIQQSMNGHSIKQQTTVTTVLHTVRFRAAPSFGVFEATVSAETSQTTVKNLKLIGEVSRLNKYRGQSDCINDAFLERYCFCES